MGLLNRLFGETKEWLIFCQPGQVIPQQRDINDELESFIQNSFLSDWRDAILGDTLGRSVFSFEVAGALFTVNLEKHPVSQLTRVRVNYNHERVALGRAELEMMSVFERHMGDLISRRDDEVKLGRMKGVGIVPHTRKHKEVWHESRRFVFA